MKFNPIDEADDKPTKRDPLPAGDYDYSVIDAEETVSAAGNDMFKIKLAVKNRHIYEYILMTEKLAWKLKAFCRSAGLLDKYSSGVVNAGDLVGVVGRCELEIEGASNGYDPKNRVKKWIPAGGGSHKEPAQSDADRAAEDEAVAKVKAALGEKESEQEEDDLPF